MGKETRDHLVNMNPKIFNKHRKSNPVNVFFKGIYTLTNQDLSQQCKDGLIYKINHCNEPPWQNEV